MMTRSAHAVRRRGVATVSATAPPHRSCNGASDVVTPTNTAGTAQSSQRRSDTAGDGGGSRLVAMEDALCGSGRRRDVVARCRTRATARPPREPARPARGAVGATSISLSVIITAVITLTVAVALLPVPSAAQFHGRRGFGGRGPGGGGPKREASGPQQDHYTVLGVSPTASTDEIRAAYKRLAREWHPDKNPDNVDEANEKFMSINHAHEVLSDDAKRREFDQVRNFMERDAEFHGAPRGGWPPPRQQPYGYNPYGGGSASSYVISIPPTVLMLGAILIGTFLCYQCDGRSNSRGASRQANSGNRSRGGASSSASAPTDGGAPAPRTTSRCGTAAREKARGVLEVTNAVLSQKGKFIVVFVLPEVSEIDDGLWAAMNALATEFRTDPVQIAWMQPGQADKPRISDSYPHHERWVWPLRRWLGHNRRPAVFALRSKASGARLILAYKGELSQAPLLKWVSRLRDGVEPLTELPTDVGFPQWSVS